MGNPKDHHSLRIAHMLQMEKRQSPRRKDWGLSQMKKLATVHPGEVLEEEFLTPLDLSANAFAKHIGVPVNRVTSIINGTRGVTGETALLFGRAFNMSAQFWMNLQTAYELRVAINEGKKRIDKVAVLREMST